jgi:hypothetical protein
MPDLAMWRADSLRSRRSTVARRSGRRSAPGGSCRRIRSPSCSTRTSRRTPRSAHSAVRSVPLGAAPAVGAAIGFHARPGSGAHVLGGANGAWPDRAGAFARAALRARRAAAARGGGSRVQREDVELRAGPAADGDPPDGRWELPLASARRAKAAARGAARFGVETAALTRTTKVSPLSFPVGSRDCPHAARG